MGTVCIIGARNVPNFIGGIETVCAQLYPQLKGITPEYSYTLFTRVKPINKADQQYAGLTLKYIPTIDISGMETLLHTLFAIIYARLFVHPQIMHLHGIGPGFFAPLSRLFGFKTVVTHHAVDYERPKWGRLGRAFLIQGERNACRYAHRVICVSQALKNDLDKRFAKNSQRYVTIRNGGSLDFTQHLDERNILAEFSLTSAGYILAVGRLEQTKAFHELIAAYLQIEQPVKKLVICGVGIHAEQYVKDLTKNASENIIFAGFQSGERLKTLYANAALFMHPSHMEGFCLVVSEALSAGVPIALSDIPPHREFKLPEQCFFNIGDIAAMKDILQQDDFSAYQSPQAFEHQSLNTWLVSAEKHKALYQAL
ncbi:glycosyltransferase family 4 protein [Paraglaciecola polaris]|uniref:Alpha-1,3-rhamnosyltransferase n=1 Tax=Paraglaciecola polaris LMG 21857 TaxID=1129793 RepID=K7A760_9ALTE|nr:glycosyltransferase family 4 protein [Paraglaciecola polaris]GAC31270.1 alpha-1,3-rhamnosyltransferase [Paraglaciecola polaris LMG 21857]